MVLLPRAQATRAAHKPPSSPQLSPREQGVALTRLSKQLRLSLRLVDRVHRNMTYAACFVAHDAVVWLTNRFDLARPAAVECGEQLRCAGLIQAALPALRDRPFAADMAFFQFLDVPAPPDPLVEPDVTAARVELGGLRLRAVPDCVLRTGIDLLSLRYNEVRTLPPTCVVWAKSLTVLDLGHNAIAVLPSAIGDLRLLRRLRVDGNVLRELPAALGQCTQLRTLSASDNLLLERVPPELAQLKALEVLQINDTRVTVLPAAWKALHGVLTELAVDAEFMRFPPADICVRSDTPALLKYLARHEDEQPPLPEIDDTVVDSLADAEANATAAAAASSAAAAAASAPPSPAAPATPAPTPLTPAPSTPAPPAPPIPPPLSDVVPPEMPAPLNDAPFPERDAMLAKSQRNSGTRARVMTLGTSQMRPTGPAPDPSTPQPWTELTDEEDAASIALFQWATNPRSTERVFHSGMKKFERGKLAPLARSAPVPVEEESAPVEPAARNKKFRDLFTSGPRTPQQQQQQQQQQPQVTAGQREMLLDGEQLAGANAPDHYEAVLLAESIDSAWMAAFDASSLSSSASSAAAARGNSTREAALQVDVEGDGDHIVRLTAPLTRSAPRTAPFVSPLLDVARADAGVGARRARRAAVRLVRRDADATGGTERRRAADSARHVFAARSMSTYAWDRASGVRLGDPICDHFAARIAPGRQIYAVADGCGWGQPSARAAQAASRTFVNYITRGGATL
jgi:hypothetical protein